MRREYPADLWLTYRAVKYRPAQLQAFVARGGWGKAPEPQWGRWLVDLGGSASETLDFGCIPKKASSPESEPGHKYTTPS